MEDNMNSASKVMELLGLGPLQMSLKLAIELKLFEIINSSSGPHQSNLSASQIASHLPTSNTTTTSTSLDRILSLLASHSILTTTIDEKGERFYGLTPISTHFVPDQYGVSLGPLFMFYHDKVLMESWSYLKDRVLEGSVPFNMAHGMEIFDYMASDERFRRVFNEGLYNHSVHVMGDLLDMYKGFQEGVVGVVVDVGGGTGASMKMLVSKYPQIKGINFDLPHVIADAPPYPGKSILPARVKHVSGDMFKGVPNGDIMFMKFILHSFDDEHCVAILKNCWNALPRHGKLLIAEYVLPSTNISEFPDDASRLAFTLDAMMLVYRAGGKERTLVEYEELGKRAGFHGMKAFPCSLGIMAMELQKE
ncbi:hypothetical protein Scep_025180 [Stephania cephalantha]|uniref:Uncharacterized protein n=1 Tax=Stephania cephalantha TaxID=152367 RepID=A0AAP0EHS4_9MAGN